MSLLPAETVKLIAEHGGIVSLKDDVAVALAHDIEYRLRDVIQEALKFMRHARRTRLSTEDINNALQRIYGVSTTAPLRFKHVSSNALGCIYYVDDEELDLDDFINAPLPKVPLDTCFTAHWLAIEGVQPTIPQNPAPIENRIEDLSRRLKSEGKYDFFERKTEVKPMVRHILSKELQLYFEKIVEALLSDDQELKNVALESIRDDNGIQQLLPYLIQFLTEQITRNLKNLQIQNTMLSLLESMLTNSNFFIEPYLHQLMPPILTCLVAKKLSETSAEDHWSARKKAARLMTKICSQYGNTYQTLQPRITRTLLRAFLDPLKALTTHYGAIVGLTHLGPEVIKNLILPNLAAYFNLLRPELSSENQLKRIEAEKCFEALMDAAVIYVAHEYKRKTAAESKQQISLRVDEMETEERFSVVPNYQELEDIFGETLADQVSKLLNPPQEPQNTDSNETKPELHSVTTSSIS